MSTPDTDDRVRAAEERAAKAEARAEKAEAALRVNIESRIRVAAQDVGFQYPDIVPGLIDLKRLDPADVEAEVERIARERPGLLSAALGGGTPPRDVPSPGGRGSGPAPGYGRGADPYDLELRALGRFGGRM